MKKECAIVQDLLVLYEDDVLKEESKEMVEEHIRVCEDCMQVYEDGGKELPVIEHVPEPSEEEKEAAADQVMKKVTRRITNKTIGCLLLAILVVLIGVTVGNNICDNVTETHWGLSSIYILPTEDISVEQLYVLKNGDLYCRLESDEKICAWMTMDWGLESGGLEAESTDEAVKELRFRKETLWEMNDGMPLQQSVVFSLKRQGTDKKNGTSIVQTCKEINIYGKTKKDKLTIWKRGQKVEEAPEEIEKEAVQLYIQGGQTAKAIRECEAMGWEDYEGIFKEYHHIVCDDYDIEFNNEGESVW